MNLLFGLLVLALTLAAQPQTQAPFAPVLDSGIAFRLLNAATPEKHQIETMPGGIAILDYDNDSRPDIFFANGAPQPSLRKSGPEWHNRLYRNLGNWKFEDVTERAGLRGEGFAMGAAAADFDNDGHTDLLVTAVGALTLYRNRGNGAFEDVTAKAGIRPTPWPVSAGWLDYNRDGHLDLFIVNYCRWDPALEPFCGDKTAGYRTYCHPQFYQPLPNVLYRNNGNGTFTDVSSQTGIAAKLGKGMGLAIADFNFDGFPDIFVANDTTPNFLFRNDSGEKFREIGLAAGVALTDDGKALSSMGAKWSDFDGDGLPDLFITALANETYPLFRNLGKELFQEVTFRSGLGATTLPYSGWSLGAYDFDLDGWPDIVTANGDVQDNTEIYSSRKSKQQNLFLRNKGNAAFQAIPFGPPAQYRGAAFADFDADGRVDFVTTQLNGPATVWRNTTPSSQHWIALRLKGRPPKSTPDAYGAIVRLTAAGRIQTSQLTSAGGYLASNEKALWFGLGPNTESIDRIEILWPSGATQNLSNPAIDRYLTVEEPTTPPNTAELPRHKTGHSLTHAAQSAGTTGARTSPPPAIRYPESQVTRSPFAAAFRRSLARSCP